jgi:hypothetical protein
VCPKRNCSGVHGARSGSDIALRTFFCFRFTCFASSGGGKLRSGRAVRSAATPLHSHASSTSIVARLLDFQGRALINYLSRACLHHSPTPLAPLAPQPLCSHSLSSIRQGPAHYHLTQSTFYYIEVDTKLASQPRTGVVSQ